MKGFIDRLFEALKDYDAEFDSEEAYRIALKAKCKFEFGATRWCFYTVEDDVVVKIPRMKDYFTDYCELEARNYEIAVKYNVQRICLPVTFVGEVNGIKLYIQPKYDYSMSEFRRLAPECEELYHKIKTAQDSKASRASANRLYRNSKNIDWIWYSRVLQLYGKRFLKSFEKFTQEAQVNDLHEGNIGWLNDRPIILDYAGYHG